MHPIDEPLATSNVEAATLIEEESRYEDAAAEAELTDEMHQDGDGTLENNETIEFDITSTPNDFNVKTIFDFIVQGTFKIPEFQRNYVWDIKRASRLIESLILGLPIPQIFLFEESRNNFLVIDGQQRLMTIYFFLNGKFPRMEKRSEIRAIYDQRNRIDEAIMNDDAYFTDFKLRLQSPLKDKVNPLNGLKYTTLGDWKTTLDLKVIRNVVIRQNSPSSGFQSKYEIFNRLNTGGVNLTPQEIRASIFYSEFYTQLKKLNMNESWRKFLPNAKPDIHLKDVEVLLRGFAMLRNSSSYSPSMTRFLNAFSDSAKTFTNSEIESYSEDFSRFLRAIENLPKQVFVTRGKFNIALFESVFVTVCEKIQTQQSDQHVTADSIQKLLSDHDFNEAATKSAAATNNVKQRLKRAKELLDFE